MDALIAPVSRLLANRSARQQSRSSLWNPAHWGASANAEGHLELDGVDLAELVQHSASPLLVVSRHRLHRDAQSFLDAVASSFPDACVAYSYKTNCVPGVLRELHTSGFLAEVISPYELWLADQLGVPGGNIIVNGVNKDAAYLEHAMRLNVRSINIDHQNEIETLLEIASRLGRKVNVALRLKIDRKSHFGLDIHAGEAYQVASIVASHPEHLVFSGLHLHELADNSSARNHTRLIGQALDFAATIQRELRLETQTLDIGGGFSVPTTKVMARWEYARQRLFDVPANPPDPATGIDLPRYFAELRDFLVRQCDHHDIPVPRLTMEPGRCITGQSHVLLSRVHSIKPNTAGPDYAMTDIGKILTSYPCDYEYHQIFVANRMKASPDKLYHLMGRLCTSTDWLARNRYLPTLHRNDVLAVMDAGAYFTSYSSNFGFPRPAILMLDQGKVSTLRQQESYEHLIAMDAGGKA